MLHVGNESALIENAQQEIGDREEVIAAGVFGLQDLVGPMVAGEMAGGIAMGEIGGNAGGIAGVLIGGLAARKLAAERMGVTLKLIVAATATRIHVLNWGDDDERHVGAFDRATTDVSVKHLGLSRIVTLHDTATGAEMKLHATVSPASPQAGPDKDVLAELSRT